MTDPFAAETAEAHRRAAHLIMLFSVENNMAQVEVEIENLANNEDTLFCAALVSALLTCLDVELQRLPVEMRREKAMALLAYFSSTDTADLEHLGMPRPQEEDK